MLLFSDSDEVSTAAVGEHLDLVNVSRHCADVYECTASNNVPPADKRHIKLTVECTYSLYTLLVLVYCMPWIWCIADLHLSVCRNARLLSNVTWLHWKHVTNCMLVVSSFMRDINTTVSSESVAAISVVIMSLLCFPKMPEGLNLHRYRTILYLNSNVFFGRNLRMLILLTCDSTRTVSVYS